MKSLNEVILKPTSLKNKRCIKCKQTNTDFSFRNDTKKYNNVCQECKRAQGRERASRYYNKLKKDKKWVKARDRLRRLRWAKNLVKNKKKAEVYRQKNREAIKERQKTYYINNRFNILLLQKARLAKANKRSYKPRYRRT